jgi:hypothetical protein
MDSSFIFELVKKFVNSKTINDKLKIIEELSVSKTKRLLDYEKWLQLEFAFFLNSSNHSDIKDWGREKRYDLDGRKKLRIQSKNTTTVDFWLHRKNRKIKGDILLEFKRSKSINGCVKAMIKDGALLRKIKKSACENDIRSFWMVGFHPSETDTHNAFEKALRHEGNLKELVSYKSFLTEEISNTSMSFTMFNFEVG